MLGRFEVTLMLGYWIAMSWSRESDDRMERMEGFNL